MTAVARYLATFDCVAVAADRARAEADSAALASAANSFQQPTQRRWFCESVSADRYLFRQGIEQRMAAGLLTPLGAITDLPAGVNGLAVRFLGGYTS